MEIIAYLASIATFSYIGWIFGISHKIQQSEDLIDDTFRKAYIKGYFDGHAAKKEKPYYEDFPEMGIN